MEPSTSKTKKPKICSVACDPKWAKKIHPTFSSSPQSLEIETGIQIENTLAGKTPYECFQLFFDDEVYNLITNFSTKYAQDNNCHDFVLTNTSLKRFLGILILTGYHTLPQIDMYWSKDEDKEVTFVRQCMSRNKFRLIKKYIHVSDNALLDKTDKFAKLRPFFDMMNQKFMQFGVFANNLSIDEEMVPYFGRHSAKMFMKGKPVRFGYKLWCLCSASGYLFQFIPYGGASIDKSNLGLGADVILKLASVIENPLNHRLFFDNFFSSYKLFKVLNERGIYATGTIRENRIEKCPLEASKILSKKDRGSYDFVFDTKAEVSVVRWNDNSVVTVISNNCPVNPIGSAKRYDRKHRKEVNIPQPHVIQEYNKFMGGVDLHDNAIANYRIGVRGKKWWWPLFKNVIDSSVVNAWKLYRLANKSSISQVNFRAYIVVCLMKSEEQEIEQNEREEDEESSQPSTSTVTMGRPSKNSLPNEVRQDKVGHIIIKHAESARRRCRQCSNHTVFVCQKCKVHLHTKCFESFHKQ